MTHLFKITDEDKLARIWGDLNGWRWPKDLPEDLKPRWWEGYGPVTYAKSQERKQGLCDVIMPFIENRCPMSKIDYWWNLPRDEEGFITHSPTETHQ